MLMCTYWPVEFDGDVAARLDGRPFRGRGNLAPLRERRGDEEGKREEAVQHGGVDCVCCGGVQRRLGSSEESMQIMGGECTFLYVPRSRKAPGIFDPVTQLGLPRRRHRI